MRNLQLISPFKDATQSADIIPAFRSAIATLPLFNECCLDSVDHPYIMNLFNIIIFIY